MKLIEVVQSDNKSVTASQWKERIRRLQDDMKYEKDRDLLQAMKNELKRKREHLAKALKEHK